MYVYVDCVWTTRQSVLPSLCICGSTFVHPIAVSVAILSTHGAFTRWSANMHLADSRYTTPLTTPSHVPLSPREFQLWRNQLVSLVVRADARTASLSSHGKEVRGHWFGTWQLPLLWPTLKPWSQRPTGLNSTQLNSTQLNSTDSWLELSWVLRVITSRRAMWSLLELNSTEIVQFFVSLGVLNMFRLSTTSWVELSPIGRCDHE